MPLQPADLFERLPELVNGDDWLVHRGRFFNGGVKVEIGDVPFHVEIAAGRIAELHRGKVLMRSVVLRVSATFRNEARWTQAWPALHVALQDVDGRTVGARVFAPSEYLGPRQTQNGLAPGQVASVAFDIAEPGGTVVAFTFDFR